MNSYPQTFSTGVQNLLETPKRMRKVIKHLTSYCTLDAYNQHPDFKGLDKNEVLSNNLEKKKINKKKASIVGVNH